ncbi:10254_t:CDS:2 [Racocetra fulgida]|uniref:10254_t:CDS:1 n=1 Tax=Racocetra fulgida TaxID=60492 RepID=A0A9N8ZN18_9GLOM|nr:10254_t:CDS:2 [Racocetra fulgida]
MAKYGTDNHKLKYLKQLPEKLKDPAQLPYSASFFLPIHREALNIHYKNVNSADEMFDPLPENIQIDNDLLVGNLTREELMSAVPGSSILKKLNNETEISLAKYLNAVILNEQPSDSGRIRETFTDALVNYLLVVLKLNTHPFILMLQPDFYFRISDKKKVSAKAEFSVVKENTMILIDEDKHIRSLRRPTEYGESQISAEILACAFTNFDRADSPTVGENQM